MFDFSKALSLFQGANKKLIADGISALSDDDTPVTPSVTSPMNGDEIQTLGGESTPLSQDELIAMQAQQPNIIVNGANAAQNGNAIPLGGNSLPLNGQGDAIPLGTRPQIVDETGVPMPTLGIDENEVAPIIAGNPALNSLPNTPIERNGGNGQGVTNPNNQLVTKNEQMPVVQGTPLQMQTTKVNDLMNQPIEKADKWKDILAYIVQGANAAFNPKPDNKIVGYNRLKRDNQLREEREELGTLQQQQKFESDQATEAERRKLLQEQQGNIATDNDQAAERQRGVDEGRFWAETAKYGYDPEKPTATQKRFLDKYGITNMPKRGASNAKLIEINGVRLERQPDGSYRDSGLPIEKRNQEELFEVTDANGDKFSYWMTSENAGKVQAEMIREGYKIEAANADKQSTIEQQNRKGQSDYNEDVAKQGETIRLKSALINGNNQQIETLKKQLLAETVNAAVTETSTGKVTVSSTQVKIDALLAENNLAAAEIKNAQNREAALKKNPFKPREFTPTQTISGQTVQTGGGNTGNKVPIEKDPLKIFQ